MTLTEKRACVFCGGPPTDKTREHVLPYWLLEMTGKPTRVVSLGVNYAKGQKIIAYSWSNYVAPACDPCNNTYSKLEDRVKPIVERLLQREALPVADYVLLLDWLDKVRTGVWLVRHMIENSPIEYTPNFYIDARVAMKDRMVAVYPVDGDGKGISLFGADSLIFNEMPSCFGLRINNILLLNASADYLCSEGCGFPYPRSMMLQLGGPDHGRFLFGEFDSRLEIANPLTRLKLFKPAVWLYQPIRQQFAGAASTAVSMEQAEATERWIARQALEGSGRLGALFRQHAGGVTVHRSPDERLEFNRVPDEDSAMLKDIAASAYEMQLRLFKTVKHRRFEGNDPVMKNFHKLKIEDAERRGKAWRTGRIVAGRNEPGQA